jgi:hypothetical protein
MSAATKDALSQADIIFNRTNVALARSQRLIQSWLPPKPEAEQDSPANQDDDDDFRGDSEIGGIGSAAQKDDSGLPEGAFKRRNPGANDKLLDSLLGKKAANAHRKAQALAKQSATAQPQTAAKPAVKETAKRPAQDSDSDDEGGRAAAFKSKRPRPSKPQPKIAGEPTENDTDARAADEEVKANVTEPSPEPLQETITASKTGGRKRPASYLDELLGQKANKKDKKKKKAAASDSG